MDNQEARILGFSEMWDVDSFWVETKSANGNFLTVAAMLYTRKETITNHWMGLCFYGGDCRSSGLIYVQWRPWSRKPTEEQRRETPWLNREEQAEKLAGDETWEALNR